MYLPHEIYNDTFENLEITYTYRANNVFQEGDFIYELKPKYVQDLVFQVLSTQYLNYINFFVWKEMNFQAHDKFIMKLLISLECQTFHPGSIIINRGDIVENLYLIEKGIVEVFDSYNGEYLAQLERYNHFGDYQILLNVKSNVWFMAEISKNVIWFYLQKERFIKLLNDYSGHMQFYLERALSSRRFFNLVKYKLHEKLESSYN